VKNGKWIGVEQFKKRPLSRLQQKAWKLAAS
jgi:hypothetical protein